MTTHTSATLREETPREQTLDKNKSHVIDASLKRRARLLITNGSIPRQTRSLIQYALERRDRHLGQMVRRVEEGEMTIDHVQLE